MHPALRAATRRKWLNLPYNWSFANGIPLWASATTWTATGGAASSVPVAGTPVLNYDFAANIDGWADASDAGGAIAWNAGGYMDCTSNGVGRVRARATSTTETGVWYRYNFTLGVGAFNAILGTAAGGSTVFNGNVLTAGAYSVTARALGTTTHHEFNHASAATRTVDAVSLTPLSLASLFGGPRKRTRSGNVVIEAAWTITARTQAGVAIVDNPINPTCGIVCYHNGTSLVVDKFTTPTTWTNVLTPTAATYGAGRKVELHRNGSLVRAWYNDVQIGADLTVSDTNILACRYVCLFNTGPANTVSEFNCLDFT